MIVTWGNGRIDCNSPETHCATSTVYWCIASKLKVPLIFFMEWTKHFSGWIYHFSISLTLAVLHCTTTKKPSGYWWYYHSRCRPPHCHGRRHGAWAVHTMSDGLILQIPCNIFLAFKWILMMRSGQNISRQLSYRFMCEIIVMTRSDDKTKLIHKNISTRIRLRALKPWVKRKFPSQ